MCYKKVLSTFIGVRYVYSASCSILSASQAVYSASRRVLSASMEFYSATRLFYSVLPNFRLRKTGQSAPGPFKRVHSNNFGFRYDFRYRRTLSLGERQDSSSQAPVGSCLYRLSHWSRRLSLQSYFF